MTNPDTALHLSGLMVAPAQVCGGVRLVPLIRQRECRDVRFELRRYGQQLGRVKLDDDTDYWAFVPHGLVLRWGEPGELESAMGSQLKKADGKTQDIGWFSVNMLHKMVKRESKNALRMLPLHLALEGFLALHFGGPKVAWKEYSRNVLSHGLGERSESAVPGAALPGFEDALRTFKIHDGQVGVMVYVADALASAFVVPSAFDYRALHYTLLSDYFGELIGRYALLYPHSPELGATPDTSAARSLADLRAALNGARQHWADFAHSSMLGDLALRPLSRQKIYDVGGMRLERFTTDLNPEQTNTIGECLTREDGELLYLKTFQLSRAQSERGWLLGLMAAADWHLESAAQSAGLSLNGLILRLDGLGFGYLLKPHLIEAARRQGI